MIGQFIKDPSATLDYAVDWAAWLGEDTITAAVFTAPSGLTVEQSNFTDTSAVVWLSGGINGEKYDVACRITTAAGRIDERSFRIQIKQR